MDKIKAIMKKVEALLDKIGKIVSWVFIILVGLSCFEVFTRRFLGKPTIWTHEILSYTFCALILLTMGYTQLYRGHANIDVFYDRLPERKKVIVDVVNYLIFGLPFVIIMMVDGMIFAATSWLLQERTPSAFNAIVYPAKTLLPIGFALFFLQLLVDFVKKIIYLVKGEQL
ncbi:MAG: TRAP transporter small permease subunit [Deltaproteobacteria bacterium]|nr:TRAP transporter small permease subunit [Deltaproteobacteria bacterium]